LPVSSTKPGARLIFVQSATTHNRPVTDHADK
jgi:hypothetical protein